MNQSIIIHGIKLKTRVKVPSKSTVDPSTEEGRAQMMDALRRVVEEHREVVEKLARR